MKIKLLGQTGADRSLDVLYQKTVNLYPSTSPEGKNQLVLYGTPGLALFATVGTGSIRGAIDFDGVAYVVVSDTLYRVDSAGSSTAISTTLNSVSGRVQMAHNGKDNGGQILIVDGTNGYIYDQPTGLLTVITAAGFPDNTTIAVFMDGYFIVSIPDITGRFLQSSQYDGTAWDSLNDFDTAERHSDALSAIVVSNRQLWLLGTHTAEPFADTGKQNGTVFEPVQSGFSQWGCIAPDSAVEMGGQVFWLSQNDEGAGLVIMTKGLQPVIISAAIINEIQTFTNLSDAYAWTYQHNGHSFYVLTFPTDKRTFVYDVLTELWHEMSDETLGYHRSTGHLYIYGKHLVGDPIGNKVYDLDWSKYTDDGRTITRLRRSGVIHGEGRQLRHYGVWIDAKTGVGNADIEDPKITLRYLNENKKWSNERTRSLGKIGEQDRRCVWRRLGRAQERVYEIKVTDPCEVVLIDAYALIDQDSEEIT